MYNRIILIGRLTRDPEARFAGETPVTSFTLAVDRSFAQKDGQKQTDFIDIVTWRQLAEQMSQYATKGRLVMVEGRLQIRSYQTQDGQKRRAAEVVADTVRFLDRRPDAHTGPDRVPDAAPSSELASSDDDAF